MLRSLSFEAFCGFVILKLVHNFPTIYEFQFSHSVGYMNLQKFAIMFQKSNILKENKHRIHCPRQQLESLLPMNIAILVLNKRKGCVLPQDSLIT